MKKIVLFVIIIFCVSCTSNRVAKKTITSNYSNVIFTPKELKKRPLENVDLLIEPLDAKKINNEIFEAAMRDGSYEKQYFFYQEGFIQESKPPSKKDKKNVDLILKVFTAIDKMLEDRVFDKNVAVNFKDKIYQSLFLDKKFGWDGSEINIQVKFDDRYENLNPYRVNNKYFSLFRLTFLNKGNDIKKFDINDFQVASGNELLYPYKNDYFESTLNIERDKLKFIHRMNMPNILTIIPNQNTIKYISIPAINTNNKSLTINYIDGDKVIDYIFTVGAETITEVFVFSAYSIQSNFNNYYQCYVVELDRGVFFPLDGNTLFINDKKKHEMITVYGLNFDHKGNVYYTAKTIIPQNIKNNKIQFKYKKTSKYFNY